MLFFPSTVKTAAVKVSDVHFVGVQGSTTADVPIYLACSQTVACTGIVLDNVQLKSEKKMTSYCLNVQGNVADPVIPEVTCLVIKLPSQRRSLGDLIQCGFSVHG